MATYIQESRRAFQHHRGPSPSSDEIKLAYESQHATFYRYRSNDVKIVPIWSENYPQGIKSHPDAPILLFVKGNLTALQNQKSVAIVGTRYPTRYGRTASYKLASYFAKAHHTVVSGLAVGCDTQSHLGCLESNGATIAVLAHGLHRIYPAQNQILATRITENRGALLSEYPLGIEPAKHTFIARNKWQIALAKALIVVETGTKGGSTHTIAFAQQTNKKIGCFYLQKEDWLNAEQTQGNKALVQQQKAKPLDSTSALNCFLEDL